MVKECTFSCVGSNMRYSSGLLDASNESMWGTLVDHIVSTTLWSGVIPTDCIFPQTKHDYEIDTGKACRLVAIVDI